MPELRDGETAEVKGSAKLPYVLRNVGGVYSCSCPAWRNQSTAIERRTCKHLRKYRGEEAEAERVGGDAPAASVAASEESDDAPVLLAESWDGERDITGWHLSEKLDGVRAYWDGTRFLSRQGNQFHVPEWFRAELPAEPLDGEFWLERKAFQRTVSIVRRQDESPLWRSIRYLIFDAPAHQGSFEQRLAHCRETFNRRQAQFVDVLAQDICRGREHLEQELERILALGGEGLMLREPGSSYEIGRSQTLLKVKRFIDAEARVVGHEPGKGRHKGRLGALECELVGGTKFSVGTGFSDAERMQPPPIGATVTFRYQELSDRGVPRFPTFVRVRSDAE